MKQGEQAPLRAGWKIIKEGEEEEEDDSSDEDW